MTLTEEGSLLVPGMLSRYVRLSTGVKAHYWTSGETGPFVILLHGGVPGANGLAGFRYMAPVLGERGFRVFCPDMPAFGLTEDPTNFYSYGQGAQVDFIQDFVNALCLDRFHLGGNSLGSSNTIHYTLNHPERVLSFALIAGGVGDIMPRAKMKAADPRPPEELPNMHQFDGSAESMRRMMAGIVINPDSISDDLVEMRTQMALRHSDFYDPNMKAIQRSIQGVSDENEGARLRTIDRLDQISIPGIYMFGKQDILIHVNAAYLQEDVLPNIQFFYPENTGHQGQTDQPELHNQVFYEFFKHGKVSWETAQRAGVSDRRAPLASVVDVPHNA